MISLLFGDIFRYLDKEYVFLAQTPEITYAAQILNYSQWQKIQALYDYKMSKGKMSKPAENNILYCYVILHTKELENKAAHFAQTARSFEMFIEKLPFSLNKEDKKAIIEEITNKNNPVPIGLKEEIKSIKAI